MLRKNKRKKDTSTPSILSRKKRIESSSLEVPSYDQYGQANVETKDKRKKWTWLIKATCIIAGIGAVLYLPQFFVSKSADAGAFLEQPDAAAIKLATQYIKDCPDDDFDGDGLTNCMEEIYGSSPFLADSDKDGVSDLAEVQVYGTSPTVTDATLVTYLKDADKKEGHDIGTPYKMGDVVLWADTYSDKAYGGVIETFGGYRFHDFNGWAQFPSGSYAYQYVDGRHSILKYRETEDAWRIDGDMVVLLYDKPLDMVNRIGLFEKKYFYLSSSVFTDFLSVVLPDDIGILTSCKMAKVDADPDMSTDVTTEFSVPKYDENDLTRFSLASDSLSAIVGVRTAIDKKRTVAVSLFSSSKGENIGVVYGYTQDGRLLVSDLNGTPLGTITIIEKAGYMLNEKQQLVTRKWFAFEGLGYSSANGDRMSFFDSSDSKNTSILNDKKTEEKGSAADKKNAEKSKDENKDKNATEETDTTGSLTDPLVIGDEE